MQKTPASGSSPYRSWFPESAARHKMALAHCVRTDWTDVLPPELICYVFKQCLNACMTDKDRAFLLVRLGGVCRRWHEIAFGVDALWMDALLELSQKMHSLNSHLLCSPTQMFLSRVAHVYFKRPWSVHCVARMFDAKLGLKCAMQSARRLTIDFSGNQRYGTPFDYFGNDAYPKAPRQWLDPPTFRLDVIKELHIYHCRFLKGQFPGWIAQCAHSLEKLVMIGTRHVSISSDMDCIASAPGLRHLELHGLHISTVRLLAKRNTLEHLRIVSSNTFAEVFSEIKYFARLRVLILARTNVRARELGEIMTGSSAHSITHLDVSHCKYLGVQGLARLTALRHLNVSRTMMHDHALVEFSQGTAAAHTLTFLNVENCPRISETGFRCMPWFRVLRFLMVKNTKIHDACLITTCYQHGGKRPWGGSRNGTFDDGKPGICIHSRKFTYTSRHIDYDSLRRAGIVVDETPRFPPVK